jgi:hypothetical protein
MTVLNGQLEGGAQRLVDQRLPHACEHLAPTALAVSNVAFCVNVVKPTMRHQVVVSMMEKILAPPGEKPTLAAALGTMAVVRSDG